MLEFTNIFLMLGYDASFDFLLLFHKFFPKTLFYHVLLVKRFYRWLYRLTIGLVKPQKQQPYLGLLTYYLISNTL